MELRCWVNFQCRGVLLVWMIVGQGPIALAVGASVGCLDIFSLIHLFSFLSPSLWKTARYRLKYCLKGPLNTKQPTTLASYCSYCPHSLVQCSNKAASFGPFQYIFYPHGDSIGKSHMIHRQILNDSVVLTKDTRVIRGLPIHGDQ